MPPPVASFLLTSRTEADDIVDHIRRCGTNTVQIVDAVDRDVYRTIRAALPQVKIVQVIHVSGPESVAEARETALLVDALLLDSGRPAAAVKELGGTGRVHDWTVSREIVAAVRCPVFLAGGLRPDNVATACREVGSFGLDLCSGVRRDGNLDPALLDAFFQAVATAAAPL